MKTNPLRSKSFRTPTSVLVGAALVIASAISALAQARTLEGVWGVTITPRDCTTQTALGPPFRTLVTFHRDGTVTESVATSSSHPVSGRLRTVSGRTPAATPAQNGRWR